MDVNPRVPIYIFGILRHPKSMIYANFLWRTHCPTKNSLKASVTGKMGLSPVQDGAGVLRQERVEGGLHDVHRVVGQRADRRYRLLGKKRGFVTETRLFSQSVALGQFRETKINSFR